MILHIMESVIKKVQKGQLLIALQKNIKVEHFFWMLQITAWQLWMDIITIHGIQDLVAYTVTWKKNKPKRSEMTVHQEWPPGADDGRSMRLVLDNKFCWFLRWKSGAVSKTEQRTPENAQCWITSLLILKRNQIREWKHRSSTAQVVKYEAAI